MHRLQVAAVDRLAVPHPAKQIVDPRGGFGAFLNHVKEVIDARRHGYRDQLVAASGLGAGVPADVVLDAVDDPCDEKWCSGPEHSDGTACHGIGCLVQVGHGATQLGVGLIVLRIVPLCHL